jgi:hypothetical protein
MIGRWFVTAYAVSVIAGLATAPWAFPQAVPVIIGLLYIPFALPFVLVATLVGWLMQGAIERLLGPGWTRTLVLACGTGTVGGLGMALITATPLYGIIAACAAGAGTLVSQHEAAWRHGWLVVLLASGIASVLGIGLATP